MRVLTKERRAALHDMELPVRFETDEDGKLHIHLDTDTIIHYHGNKGETIDGSTVEFTKGNQYIITQGEHHTNPWGGLFYDTLIEAVMENDELREIMEAKLQYFKEHTRVERKFQHLRDKLAKRSRRCRCGKKC